MARASSRQIVVTGTLRAMTPLHVGGIGPDVDTDLPLARDGLGRVYVPGTSLAGALRQWFEAAFGEDDTKAVWGYQKSDEGDASRVVVCDLAVSQGADEIEVRDGVGIDRCTGTAAERIKHDRAVLPSGSVLEFRLEVELPRDAAHANRYQSEVGHLLTALKEERIRLGAATTRGLGRIKLQDEKIEIQDRASKKGILEVLRGGVAKQAVTDLLEADPDVAPKPQEVLRLTVTWAPRGPVMVKAGYDGIAVDSLPLMTGRDGQLAPVLPGSSIKGALRSQAERIVRTVKPRPAPQPTLGGQPTAFLDQIEGLELVEWLFGSTGGDDSGATVRLGRGALRVDDCLGASIDPAAWQAIESASTPEGLRTALNGHRSRWQHAYHVAVDRWTGGAADNLLFTVLEPFDQQWEPIRMEVDLARLPDAHRQPCLALLALTLQDLEAGRVPLGFGVNRGMGDLSVSDVSIDGCEAAGPQDAMTLDGLLTTVRSEWQNWAKSKEGDSV